MSDPPIPLLVDPPLSGDERETLGAFLDYQRAVMARKAFGLSHEQLNRALPPSSLTIAKLLRHLTLVEHDWLHGRFLGLPVAEPWAGAPWDDDRDWEMTTAVDQSPEDLLAMFHDACAESRRIVAEAPSLDAFSVVRDRRLDEPFNLRWILVHLIEEYARHLGHADFLRESIDGTVGD